MRQHFLYGPEARELGWVPMPRYVLRRNRVLTHLGEGNDRRLLDIGCGAGALLVDMAIAGFRCTGLDSSEKARTIARSLNQPFPETRIEALPQTDWVEQFDVVTAFEVLEHIQDDRGALKQWLNWLKPGGLFLASVPCHMKKWSPQDEWAGHVRRYERLQFCELITSQELDVISFENYGYPMMRILESIRSKYYRNAMLKKGKSAEDSQKINTSESGIDRESLLGLYRFCTSPIGVAAMTVAIQLQKLFLSFDRGDGFLVVAKKR